MNNSYSPNHALFNIGPVQLFFGNRRSADPGTCCHLMWTTSASSFRLFWNLLSSDCWMRPGHAMRPMTTPTSWTESRRNLKTLGCLWIFFMPFNLNDNSLESPGFLNRQSDFWRRPCKCTQWTCGNVRLRLCKPYDSHRYGRTFYLAICSNGSPLSVNCYQFTCCGEEDVSLAMQPWELIRSPADSCGEVTWHAT